MTDTPQNGIKNGLTYKDAGVDIDAGEALVARIGPAAKSTRPPRRPMPIWAVSAACST